MNATQQGPQRLYLFQLATITVGGSRPVPGYLIQTGDGINVLIDTGFPKSMIGETARPGRPPVSMKESEYVVNQLAALGLKPSDIHYLIATHFDVDHSGNHEQFTNAELLVQRQHYELATSGFERFAQNREHWGAPGLRYRQVDGDTELLPGIELIESSGHVPGHQSVLVRLPQTGPVLLTIDAIPNQSGLDADKRERGPFDMNMDDVRASTRKLVALAQREHVALIVHGHDAAQWKTLKKAPEYYS
jgi:N-acyl homoserine lactone hydrolase